MKMQHVKIQSIEIPYRVLIAKQHLQFDQVHRFIGKVKNKMSSLAEFYEKSFNLLIHQKNKRKSSSSIRNCLCIMRFMLETCEYIPVSFTQYYFIDILEQIALKSFYNHPSDDNILSRHKSGLQKIEEQAVELQAISLILLAADIKPSRTFKTLQLNEPSEFAKTARRLSKFYQSQGIYSMAEQMIKEKKGKVHQKFSTNKNEFLLKDNRLKEEYRQYLKDKFQECMIKGVGLKSKQSKFRSTSNDSHDHKNHTLLNLSDPLPLMKILKLGDSFFNEEILGYSMTIIQNSDSITERNNALVIIGQLAYWGDLECLILINFGNIFQQLTEQIVKEKNGKIIIFPDIKGQTEEKYQFLRDLLKYIELWANFIPRQNLIDHNSNEPSAIAQLFRELKKRKINFPHNSFEKLAIKQFKENMILNFHRNELIRQEYLHQNISGFSSREIPSSVDFYSISQEEESLKADSFGWKIKQMIESVEQKLQALLQTPQKQIQRQLKKIKRQMKFLDLELKKLEEVDKKSTNMHNFRENSSKQIKLLRQGSQLRQKIIKIDKIYLQYEKGSMSFKILNKEIMKILNLNPFQNTSKTQSKVSFDSSSAHSIKTFVRQKFRKDSSFESSHKNSIMTVQNMGKKESILSKIGDQSFNKIQTNAEKKFKSVCTSLSSSFIPESTKEQAIAKNFPGQNFSIKSPSRYSQYSQSSHSKSRKLSEGEQNFEHKHFDENIVTVRETYYNKNQEKNENQNIHSTKRGEEVTQNDPQSRIPAIFQRRQGSEKMKTTRSHTVGIMVTVKESFYSDKKNNLRKRANGGQSKQSESISSTKKNRIFRESSSEQKSFTIASSQTSNKNSEFITYQQKRREALENQKEKNMLKNHSSLSRKLFSKDNRQISQPIESYEAYMSNRQIISSAQISEQVLEVFDEKTRKKLMKNKNLFVRNDEIEIGSSISKEGSSLTVIYYITAFKEVFDFTPQIQPSNGLKIQVFPIKTEEKGKLKQKKQYRLCVSVEMKKYVYYLPKISFSYKWMEKQKKCFQNQFSWFLPVLSIKFIETTEIDAKFLQRQFSMHPIKFIRQIPLEQTILKNGKIERIHQIFTHIVLCYQQPGLLIYGTKCIFQKSQFLLKIQVKKKNIGEMALNEEGFVCLEGLTHDDEELMTHCLCMYSMLLKSDDFSMEPTSENPVKSPFKKIKI